MIRKAIIVPILDEVESYFGTTAMKVVSVLLAAIIITLIPLLGIWSINVLFGFEIAYTFINWFAFFILSRAVS